MSLTVPKIKGVVTEFMGATPSATAASKGLIIWKRGSPVDGLGHLLRFELC